MKSRVEQFTALVAIDKADFVEIPKCGESWCRWVLTDSAAFANALPPRPPRQLPKLALPLLPVVEENGQEEGMDDALWYL